MEYWNIGMMGKNNKEIGKGSFGLIGFCPTFHFSIIPSFHVFT
jgi:hypothetical protein